MDRLHHIQQTPTDREKPRIAVANGHHDDLVMVLATTVHMMRRKKEYANFDLAGAQPRGGEPPRGSGLGFGGTTSKWDLGGAHELAAAPSLATAFFLPSR